MAAKLELNGSIVRSRRHLAIGALFFVNAAVSLSLAFVQHNSWFISLVAWGIVFAQASLLAIWSALGGARFLPRLGGSLLLLGMASAAMGLQFLRHGGTPGFVGVVAIVLGQWALIQAPLWPARLGFRYRVERPFKTSGSSTAKEHQFNLAQLLIVTAGLGVLLGIGRFTNVLGALREIFGDWWQAMSVAVIFLSNVVLTVLACWLTLGQRKLGLRLAVVASLAGGTIWLTFVAYSAWVPNFGGGLIRYTPIWLNGAYFVWLIACLLVVRLAGYRLVRRTAASSEAVLK